MSYINKFKEWFGMSKGELRRYGLDESFLLDIVAQNGDIFGINNLSPNAKLDYKVKSVKKGALLHAKLYHVPFNVSDGKQEYNGKIFVKDSRHNANVSGHVVRSRGVDENEVNYMTFGKDQNLFIPRYFTHKEVRERFIILMQHFDQSLEDKLVWLYEQREKTTDPKARSTFEQMAVDDLKRAIDINMVNNNLATNQYQHRDAAGRLTVYDLTQETLASDLMQFYHGLKYLDILPKSKREQIESARVDIRDVLGLMDKVVAETAQSPEYEKIRSIMSELIARPIAENQRKQRIVHLDVDPGHILMDGNPSSSTNTLPLNLGKGSIDDRLQLNSYDQEGIHQILEGNVGDNPYNNLAITDYNKVGAGSPAFGVATLLSHPSVLRLLSKERIDELVKHAMVTYQRVEQKQAKVDLDPAFIDDFKKQFDAVSRYALMHYISNMSWLLLKNPIKLKDRQQRQPLFTPSPYINTAIDRIMELNDPYESFKPLNKALEKLRRNGE